MGMFYILAVTAILAFTALIELRMGRLPFCKCGLIYPVPAIKSWQMFR